MSTVRGGPADMQPGRTCLLCGTAWGPPVLTATLRDGTQVWQCYDAGKCADRATHRDGLLLDWPCHHAEHTERITARVPTDLSWRDWHYIRYEITGDKAELVRMGRHPAAAVSQAV